MATNLACIGMDCESDDEFTTLMQRAFESGALVATQGDVQLVEWQDADGARLVFAVDGSEVLALTPSLVGSPGAQLRNLVRIDDQLWSAEVVDADGEQLTALVADIEGAALIDPGQPPLGSATIVSLGVQVEVVADAEAFEASPASLLSDAADEPPADYVENGWSWPPRWSAESFVAHGLFDPDNGAYAQLNGTVLSARTGRNSLTGQEYQIARVRTAGFETDLALPASEHGPLQQGNVVTGIVYVVARFSAE